MKNGGLTSRDWLTDLDHTDPEYAAHAPEIWAELRSECPVARSDQFGGMWIPTRYEDVSEIAHDTDNFSSRGVIVSEFEPGVPAPVGYAPPITSDPPFHAYARRLLLPAFSPKAIEPLRQPTTETCDELLDEIVASHHEDGSWIDAAAKYAQEIPVRVIAKMLGLPLEDGDRFRRFIHRILETGGRNADEVDPQDMMGVYIEEQIAARDGEIRDDLIGYLMAAEIDGVRLDVDHIHGTIALLIIAGIDTTWSAIGASLWYLAQNPADRRRLVTEPELMVFAVEELLRAFSPVTMARKVAHDVEFRGCPMKEGDWLLLPFPAANRDPEAFEDAESVVLDRTKNRHAAFGLGIHRCLGSNLARMELTTALQRWLARIPDFELADPRDVIWSKGQVRGPRKLPIRILELA